MFENKKQQKFGYKALILLVSVALIVGIAAGGTLAWLTDKTDEVKNVFTPSDVDITLAETTGENYKMIPGFTIEKDPKVTVSTDSEDCFVFVKLKKSENYSTYLADYEIADGWTALLDEDGVYYREVMKSDTSREFAVIKDNKLRVLDSVTKGLMNDIDETAGGTGSKPTLIITAYACQYYKTNDLVFTAEEAWANVGSPTT